jgi:hypothetical protein
MQKSQLHSCQSYFIPNKRMQTRTGLL